MNTLDTDTGIRYTFVSAETGKFVSLHRKNEHKACKIKSTAVPHISAVVRTEDDLAELRQRYMDLVYANLAYSRSMLSERSMIEQYHRKRILQQTPLINVINSWKATKVQLTKQYVVDDNVSIVE